MKFTDEKVINLATGMFHYARLLNSTGDYVNSEEYVDHLLYFFPQAVLEIAMSRVWEVDSVVKSVAEHPLPEGVRVLVFFGVWSTGLVIGDHVKLFEGTILKSSVTHWTPLPDNPVKGKQEALQAPGCIPKEQAEPCAHNPSLHPLQGTVAEVYPTDTFDEDHLNRMGG